MLSIKKQGNNKLSFNPSSDVVLKEGDIMIVLGKEEQVNELKKIANDSGERNLNI